MLRITEGSPLYLEDLLRLCSVMPIATAIGNWRDRAGDGARQYALGRELEMLTPRAKEVLVAACIPSKPVSHVEIEAMTGLSTDEIAGSLKELQKIFLVPKPALYEGEERYNVNINTKLLVRKGLGDQDSFRRIQEAFRNLTKGSGSGHDPVVSAAIRRAAVLVRAQEQAKAEAYLKNAISMRPNQPDLLAFLGWVYKAWVPRRITEAREQFLRAVQLKCSNADMYRHWFEMESEQKEWAKAAEAAEQGIKLAGETSLLLFNAGYAHGRLGRELLQGLHSEKAKEELLKSRRWLRMALRVSASGKDRPSSELFRALVLSAESLNRRDELVDYFKWWLKFYPGDIDARTEWARLAPKFGLEH